VPRQLHRHALRDAGADEIADSGSPKVVEDETRASRFDAGSPKGDPEALDRLPCSMKDVRRDDLAPSLQSLRDRSLVIKQFAQVTRHREGPSLSVFRLARIESDFAGAEIDLSPLDRQDLTVNSPPRDVREVCDGTHWLWQSLKHCKKLLTLKEADPDRG
jgi:hypothetical protein